MARKPETTFRQAVEKKLPREVHREKMNNPYSAGTADSWYSGSGGDLWVEYKFLPSLPQRGVVNAKRIGLTKLQLDWLRGRHKEGRNVAVIVGTPVGGVVLRDLEWESEVKIPEFIGRVLAKTFLAEWIAQQTL